MKKTLHLYKIAFLSLLLFSCSKEIDVSIIEPDPTTAIDPTIEPTIDTDTIDELSGEGIISEFSLTNNEGLELTPVNQSINQEEMTISLEYSFGTDLSAVFTKINVSDEATVTPNAEATVVDLTQPVNFIVTAANGTENSYKVIATTPEISEKQALLNMKIDFPNSQLNWNADTDITTWNAITVKNGHVTELNYGIDVTKSINFTSDIKNLIHLKSIGLVACPAEPNVIFPDEIGLLKQLEVFIAIEILDEFPEALVMNTNLKNLIVSSRNGAMINKIPEDISNLKKLENLDLGGNDILSSLPESIGKLTNLKTLRIINNPNLKTIPNSICELERIGTVITKDPDVTCL